MEALRTNRAIWVRDMQPGLVAADQTISLMRLLLSHIVAPFFNWSCAPRFAPIMISLSLALSIGRYYYSRNYRANYTCWRWAVVLLSSSMTAVGWGKAAHCFAAPSHNMLSYLKNLFLGSGILFTVQFWLFDREMFPLSWLCSMLQVLTLYSYSEVLCREGLLATQFSTGVTRSLFQLVGKGAHLVANVMRPFEQDPLLAAPGTLDSNKDLPYCLCLVQTLLIACSILPNALLYMHDMAIINRARRRMGEQQPDDGDEEVVGDEGVLGRSVTALLTAISVTLLGGTVAWAGLRSHHDV